MKKRLIISFIFLIIWTIFIKTNNTSWFDEPIYNFIISFKDYALTSVMRIISFFASAKWLIGICLVCLISLLWKKYYSLYLMCTLFFSTGCNLILKAILKRDRPSVLWLTNETGFSYPSGHAMASMAFYGAIMVLVKYSNVSSKKAVYISTGILIFLIGVSRVYLGVHYPSDIIGGWIMGYIILCVLDYIVGGIYEGTIKWR